PPYARAIRLYDLASRLVHRGVDMYKGELAEWFATFRGAVGFEVHDLSITVGDGVAFATSLNRITGKRTNGEQTGVWVRATIGFAKRDGGWKATQPRRDRAMGMSWILIAVLAVLVAVVVLSYILEALRSAPKRPETLVWASRIPMEYVDLGGMRVRCIRTGVGPNLVLLHTLRTQLDIFEKIIPELEKHFTVHAFDYPGHGWSALP